MNFKTTIALAIVAAALGIAYFVVSRTPAPTEDDTTPKPSAPPTKSVFEPRIEAADVVAIQLDRTGKPTLKFTRTGNKDANGQLEPWTFADNGGATESYMVDGFVYLITGLQSTRSFAPGSAGNPSAADAGLEPPRAVLTATTRDGKTHTLQMGAKLPLSNDTYVRVAGAETIHVTARSFDEELKKSPNDYRAKSLFRIARNQASHVVAAIAEGRRFDFSKSSSDDWVMNEPAKGYAEKDAIRALVNALANVRVDEYVDDAPTSLAALGLDPPQLTLSVTTEEKKPLPATQPAESQPAEPQFETIAKTHTLLVGGYADIAQTKRYVKLPDATWVASATKETIDPLIPDLAKLRDKRVTRVKTAAATRVELTSGGATAVLTKAGESWAGEGDLSDLDRETVLGMLLAFEDLRAIEFIDEKTDDPRYGLASPRATIRVTVAGVVEPVTLHIGGPTSSGLNTYVQVAGQSSVMVVSTEQASRLALSPMALRSRAIVTARPDEIRAITLVRPSGTVELKQDGGWKLVSPAGAPVDPAAIRDLTNDLARLRGKSVVARDADAEYGLAEPLLRVRFTLYQSAEPAASQPEAASQPGAASAPADGPPAPTITEIGLRVGRKDNKTYCRREDQPFIFELDETVQKTLMGEMIRRQLFDFDTSSLAAIRIESNNGMVEFERSDKEWKYTPDTSVKLSKKKLDDFALELAGLRVEQYIAYSGAEHAASAPGDPVVVTLRLKDGTTHTLKVDQVKRGELPRAAVWVEKARSFLLRQADAERLIRGLDAYIGTDETAPPGAAPGAAPPIPPG